MLRFRYTMLFAFTVTLGLAMFLSCSSSSGGDDSDNGAWGANNDGSSSSNGDGTNPDWPFDSSDEALQSTPGLEDLNLQKVIKIEYKSGNAPVITNTFSEVSINPTGENVVVRINTSETEYNFVLSGIANNGSLKIYGDVRKGLYLNGVSITNNTGPAINIQGGKRALVHLLNGTQNFLADGPNYNIPSGEQAKGTFFSEGKLLFDGSGSLEVRAKYKHAIAVDNDFEIRNGRIIINGAANDGIHANDMIEVKGGVLKITSKGDTIQSENEYSAVMITGGKIAATTTDIKSHGIISEGPTIIKDKAIVQISVSGNGSKGILSRNYVDFLGGKLSIKTSGTRSIDNSVTPPDTSAATGIKLATDLSIKGGELTIKSLGDKAKGINTDRNIIISAGNVNIDADDDGMRVHGNLKIDGGIVYVKSRKKNAIDCDGTVTGRDKLTAVDKGGAGGF